jgi:hypothetical protein
MDRFSFVENPRVGFLEVVIDPQSLGLMKKIILGNGAKKKSWELMLLAILQNRIGPWQESYSVMVLPKNLPKDFLETLQGNPWEVLLIKSFVGQVELFAKGFSVKERLSVEPEDVIGGGQDGCEVVD